MSGRKYSVGYGKPPLASRFKPGQSGNPKGRPCGTRNLRTDLEEELSSSLVVHENGKPRRVSKQRATVKVLFEKALKGDIRAIGLLLGLLDRIIGHDQKESDVTSDPEADTAILRRALSRLRGELEGAAPRQRDRRHH